MDTGLDNRGTFYKLINTIQQNSGSQNASRVVDKTIKGERVKRKTTDTVTELLLWRIQEGVITEREYKGKRQNVFSGNFVPL